MLMLRGTITESPVTKKVEAESIATVTGQPQHPAYIPLQALLECEMRVNESSKTPLAPVLLQLRCRAPILIIVSVVVVPQTDWDFFKHEEARVAGIVPSLPVIQKSVQFPFLITEQTHDRVCDVA
jgi:hypothetical protein